ncbi:GNAT family N-acetyltransferase [Dyella silvatica]|uniref:GNAT family N-acetyltransferase n=1 Tax=Dyella silvatica TaxID=2992128 RepID=UPI00225825EF|nr:GNAT family N-acetyltransferase [Dyella silvatica]
MSAGTPDTDGIRVTPYEPSHREAIARLILSIQRDEFGFDITLEQQPDLSSIPAFYQRGAGNFWVALAGDSVIGTIALTDIGANQVALRKMFVAASHRGAELGIAARLLDVALRWASQHAVKGVLLGTTEKFRAAHRFYEKHGFTQVAKTTLPSSFPLMAADTRFYRLDLAQPTHD